MRTQFHQKWVQKRQFVAIWSLNYLYIALMIMVVYKWYVPLTYLSKNVLARQGPSFRCGEVFVRVCRTHYEETINEI